MSERVFQFDFPTRYSAVRRGRFATVDCSQDKPMTVQADKEACDLNKIMARYKKTGELPPGLGIGNYGDFSDVGEYQDALIRVENAREQFGALPSKVRERFHNDPAEMLAFVHDERNLEEAFSLGLLSDEYKARREAKEADDKRKSEEADEALRRKIKAEIESAGKVK